MKRKGWVVCNLGWASWGIIGIGMISTEREERERDGDDGRNQRGKIGAKKGSFLFFAFYYFFHNHTWGRRRQDVRPCCINRFLFCCSRLSCLGVFLCSRRLAVCIHSPFVFDLALLLAHCECELSILDNSSVPSWFL